MNNKPQKEKKLSARIFVLIICGAMALGVITMPILSIFASAETDDSTLIVSTFEKGNLQSALDEARGGVDFNQITKLAILSGTLATNDYGAICSLPNLEIIELSGCEAENGIMFDNAIQGRNNLSYISLPKNLTEIGRASLANNKRLVKIDMPSTVTRILDYAFENCEGLTDITLPLGLQFLGSGAFNGCRSLVEIDLPLGLTAIPDNCFNRCYGLIDLHIPPTVGVIGSNAFADCDSLKGIYFYSQIAPTPVGGMFPQNGKPTVHAIPDSIGFDSSEWTKVEVLYDVEGDKPYYYSPTNETQTESQTESTSSESTTASSDETAIAVDTDSTGESTAVNDVSEDENNDVITTTTEELTAPASTQSGGISLGTVIVIVIVAVVLSVGLSVGIIQFINKKKK